MLRSASKICLVALAGVLVLTVVAARKKGAFVDCSAIRQELLAEPVQESTDRKPFTFDYAGHTYEVEPVARYEIAGLVVSHNSTTGMGDIYHDSTSVDTKDLALIWGKNLRTNDFQEVEFWSGSWTCYARWQRGVTFHTDSISNNHLVTDDAGIRDRIGSVRVGDQVLVRGSLVNYRDRSHPEFWRRSSTTRTDDGNGACEVLYVDELEILERATPGWYLLHGMGRWLVGLLALSAVVAWGASLWPRLQPPPAPVRDEPVA